MMKTKDMVVCVKCGAKIGEECHLNVDGSPPFGSHTERAIDAFLLRNKEGDRKFVISKFPDKSK